jgi:chromate reductase, NAD(P)H dehydrogenase (quinone)
MRQPRILAFAGSARRDSYNKRLIRIAARGAEEAGAEVTLLDLADYPLPLFNEDLEREEGMPEPAARLKRLFLEHDGLLISSPEYNSAITPLLKNVIDWMSRREGNEVPLAAFQGKVAALMSASPGALGGLRGLVHVRSILGNIQVLVLPDQVSIPGAHEAFAGDGALKNDDQQAKVLKLGAKLTETLRRLTDG